MEDIVDIIVTETTNLIEITSQPTDEIIDVNIIDNREDVTLNVTPTVVEININSLTGNFGVNWGEIGGTLSSQTDLNTALGLKADLVGGKVPSSQLPSYVDDVVEVANYAALPATGETGKIYVTIDTNYIYRWTGSVYVEIKDSSAVWGAITGTLSNQTDLQNALNAKANDNAVVHLVGTETITGAKTFSSALTAPNFVLSGGTGNTGLYYGHTDRVVLANYTTGGIDFEVNGGSIVATLFPSGNYGLGITLDAGYKLDVNGTTRISGALSGTSASFSSSITASFIVKSGGTSSQFLKADGSIDSSTYLTTSSAASTYVSGSGTTNYLPRWSSSKVLTDSFIYTNGNFTEIQGQGLTASMGIVVSGRYGSVANAPKIYSSDETTGVAHIEFVNGGGEIRLGVEKSTGGQILPGSSAYATVLTAGLSGRNLEFGTNNTKRMTIDGTTGAVTLTSALSGTSASFTSSATATAFIPTSSLIPTNGMYLSATNTLGFATNGTIAFSINSNGQSLFNKNLGIGVIPTSWTTSTNVIQLGIGGAVSSRSAVNNLQLSSNYYRSAALTNLYINSDFATLYEQSSGAHTFYTSSSGTAGSAISFSNVFNIAQSGAATFSSSVTATELYLSTSNGLVGNINSSNANGGYLTWQTSGTTIADIGTLQQIFGSGGSTNFGINARGAKDLAFGTNNTERLRITSSGNVGIGTTSPTAFSGYTTLTIDNTSGSFTEYRQGGTNTFRVGSNESSGGFLYTQGSTPIRFGTIDTERMRITSGGAVIVNTTSASGLSQFQVNGNIETRGNSTIYMLSNTGGTAQSWWVGQDTSGANDGIFYIYNATGSKQAINISKTCAIKFNQYGAGALTTDASGNITAASDRTLKNVIRPIENVLENIKDFEPVYFKWNEKTELDKENIYMSTIAQSIQKHYPDAVGKMPDGTLTVQDRAVTAILVQAIKELKAELDTLKNK